MAEEEDAKKESRQGQTKVGDFVTYSPTDVFEFGHPLVVLLPYLGANVRTLNFAVSLVGAIAAFGI